MTLGDALRSAAADADVKDGILTALQTTVTQRDITIADLQQQLADCHEPPPPPPPTRVIRFGRNAEAPELDGAISPLKFTCARVFNTTSVKTSVIDPYLNAGMHVYLSVKSFQALTDACTIYAGVDDLTAIYHHEPENEGITGPAFMAEQRAARDIINGRLRFAPCLMASTFGATGASATAWLPTDVDYDAICVDGYLRAIPWTANGIASILAGSIAYSKARNLPLAITEVGVPQIVGAATATQSQQAAEVTRLHGLVAANPHIEAVMYWHEALVKDGVNRDYRFVGRLIVEAAFESMIAGAGA